MRTEVKKILLLEDDPNLGFMVQENLKLRGFEVTRCLNGEEGLTMYHREQFDICLIDIMMPKKDGFTFAREVRLADQRTPLIFLTAKALKEDAIEGFEIGADDYVTKPFNMEELVLRIQAVLKRTALQGTPRHLSQFTIGAYVFDYDRRILQAGSKKRTLTTKEADLLRLLCEYLNSTLPRDTALKTIWKDNSYFSGRSMDVFISRLRTYLKEDQRVAIVNVHGEGYKLIVS